jgi:molybdate transport system regulatory protein
MPSEIQPRPAIRAGRQAGGLLTPEMLGVLSSIESAKSLTRAAAEQGVSYRHLWSTVREMEASVGRRLVVAVRGGRGGGGGAKLTKYAQEMLRRYRVVSAGLQNVAGDEGFWESLGVKMSVRNRLKGRVVSVVLDEASAKVVIHVEGPVNVTSLITREAAEELQLKAGDLVEALVKSTEVMILKQGRPRTF